MKFEEEPFELARTSRSTELAQPVPSEWPDTKIFQYLLSNVFSLPGKQQHGTHYFTLHTPLYGDVMIPMKYRIPLLWTVKYQWHSLFLVLTAKKRKEEWEEYKLRILHVARIVNGFLEEAKKTVTGSKCDKTWRCPMFDRVLVRYWDHYLINDQENIDDYERKYGQVPYKDDVLRQGWKRWAATGSSGFRLTEGEMQNGIKAEQFTLGLAETTKDVWEWETKQGCLFPSSSVVDREDSPLSPTPPPSRPIEQPKRRVTKPEVVMVRVKKEKEEKSLSRAKPARKATEPRAKSTSKEAKSATKAEEIPASVPPKLGAKSKALAEAKAKPTPASAPQATTKSLAIVAPKAHAIETAAASVNSGYYKPMTFLSTAQSTAQSISTARIPSATTPTAPTAGTMPMPMPATPLLTSIEAQLSTLQSSIEDIKLEQQKSRAEHVRLQEECVLAQMELRALKRSLDTAAVSSNTAEERDVKRRRVEEEAGVSSYHPLSHLLDTLYSPF